MIPVEGHNNLFRDEKTGAIVNLDTTEYSHYIKMRTEKQKQKEEIQKIKSDIEEIKMLLKELLNGPK